MIPVVLLNEGWVVQSKQFKYYQNIGNPSSTIKRLTEWGSDELIFLDITQSNKYDLRRDDQGYKNRNTFLEIISDISKFCFMPIAIGGKIQSLSDIEARLRLGADKVCINTKALTSPEFVADAAKEFGSQCIVVSIDVKKTTSDYKVLTNGGHIETKYALGEAAHTMQESGAGELLVNSIDRDGAGIGYDTDIYATVTDVVDIPVIACGGVGDYSDFSNLLANVDVDAVAAANIFHYRDQAVFLAKKHLYEKGLNFRRPKLQKSQTKRN